LASIAAMLSRVVIVQPLPAGRSCRTTFRALLVFWYRSPETISSASLPSATVSPAPGFSTLQRASSSAVPSNGSVSQCVCAGVAIVKSTESVSSTLPAKSVERNSTT
jgi:hypothetical protein